MPEPDELTPNERLVLTAIVEGAGLPPLTNVRIGVALATLLERGLIVSRKTYEATPAGVERARLIEDA